MLLLKLYQGRSDEQKIRLVGQIVKDVTATLNCGEESVSVAIEDIEPGDWAEKVYRADIVPNREKLYKKPGYTAVCPGTIDTPMVADMLSKEPDAMKDILRDQPIGRLGRPEEIAAAVLWLCSPGASFVIGHALAVDGGYTVR
jgi:phenylpyruvate tautomerase PptA (4-oxalocrotonate tautomerase family)